VADHPFDDALLVADPPGAPGDEAGMGDAEGEAPTRAEDAEALRHGEIEARPVHTQPCESVVDLARGADEAGGQCGTKGAARMTQAAGVQRLILSHIGPPSRPSSDHGKGHRRRRIYEGEIVFSTEGLALDLRR
jgi:hypothetical protein